jgi:hypothetical protein
MLNKLRAIADKWDQERREYGNRMDKLVELIKNKVKQAQSVVQTTKTMEKELASFDREESSARPGIPAVYSVGGYKQGEFRSMVKINFKPLFTHLLETVSVWRDLVLGRINQHNTELNNLRKECGLQPMQNQLAKALGEYFNKLIIDKTAVRAQTEVQKPDESVAHLEQQLELHKAMAESQ